MIRRYRLPTITWLTFAALLAGVLVTGAVGGAERSSSYTAALESIHAEELAGHVNYLASDALEGRGAGTRGGRAAGDYLAKQYAKLHLRGAGPDGGYFQPFAAACRNVLAMLPGRDPELKKQYVLVCAHYDHLGDGTHGRSLGIVGPIHPGADDNASGTAGVLELAHAMRLAPALKRSLLFASWDSEEEGMLGSKHWLAQPTVPLESLTIVLNLDMIGRLRGEHLAVLGSRTAYGLRRLVCQENEGSRLLLEFDWTLIANSDHHPFYERGIPVLLLHTGLHADYHRPSDTAEKINSQGMCEVDRLLFALVYELANRPEPPRFRAAAPGRRKRPAAGWSSPCRWRNCWTARRCGWASPGGWTTPSPVRSSSARWFRNRWLRGRACRSATASTRLAAGGSPTTLSSSAGPRACPSPSSC